MKKLFYLFLFTCLFTSHNSLEATELRIYEQEVPIKVGAHFYDYQNYHNIAYFHGGLDLVAPAGTKVYTPIEGRVEVLDYTINATLNPPSFVYKRKPFKKGTISNTRYLEVAITNETRQETWMFRHINPSSIPDEIFTAAENNTIVKAGTKIGKVAAWIQPVLPEKPNYDHIHLEILDFDQNYINPGLHLNLGKDFYPPTIKELYVLDTNTNEAVPYSAIGSKAISGKIKLGLLANDRMNSSRYLHAMYKATWTIYRLNSNEEKEEILSEKIFQFDKLPFKGDRTQLSKIIYYDSLKLKASSNRVRANGNDGPRIFLINLTCGSIEKGYSDESCLDTTKLDNGEYELMVEVEDFCSNKRSKSYKFNIFN